jgi:DNA invertase Pin-like site-specific DNA recombinase
MDSSPSPSSIVASRRARRRAPVTAAKSKGVYKGRAFALSPERARQFVEEAAALRRGETLAGLARKYRISRASAYQYTKRAKQAERVVP